MQANLPVVWYTLDSTDRDPHLFLDYLLSAEGRRDGKERHGKEGEVSSELMTGFHRLFLFVRGFNPSPNAHAGNTALVTCGHVWHQAAVPSRRISDRKMSE
jgi:hypothetical protein